MTGAQVDGAPTLTRLDHADGVPRPYTASASYGGLVWACGQVPRRSDGTTPTSIEDQVAVALDSLEAVLLRAGSSLGHLLKVTVFLADLDEFDAYDAAYQARLSGVTLPPRTTVEVARFRGDKRIEIDAVGAVEVTDRDGTSR
ncbi:RidA family protein [Nocardioides iriomotensis]|uniref:RidA family protein n=1 Tax=Nocardioides iriomotensis TaxID=715784 RepID=A0A4Q5JAP0_9ACTN|nr:RidA family protein [Nocardioides iriomotensis]RYU14835.1 RidA family protein [Nocardioides iriomotensis]